MTNKSYLPEKGTAEADQLIEQYKGADLLSIEKLANHYGYKSRDSFIGAMRKRLGVYQDQPDITIPEISSELTDLEDTVLRLVKKEAMSVGAISREIDRSSETVIKVIDGLNAKHYDVKLNKDTSQVEVSQIPGKSFRATEFNYFHHTFKVGFVSDTQFGSKYQQVTLLHDAYSHFDSLGVDFAVHVGDVVDGANMYRGQVYETFLHGIDDQREYTIKNYPKPKGRYKTYMIGGNHDYSFYKQNGFDIIKAICEERDDLVYRGFFTASFKVKGAVIGLHHPGGGVAYARSYKIQKMVENLVGYINTVKDVERPALLAFGHWHIGCHLPLYMGVDAFSLPCFQAQTPYLAEKGLMPQVGYVIANIKFDEEWNLTSTSLEFVNQNTQVKKDDF